MVKQYACKKAPYENGQMLAPDGELLSYTDQRKAMWYVEKGLATLTNTDPLIVTLNFEPSGR